MQHVIPSAEKTSPQLTRLQCSIPPFSLLVILSLASCGEGSNAFSDASDTLLGTVNASLDSDDRTLLTEGKGEKGQTVTLRIPDIGVVVGITTVSDNGEWSLQVVGLRDIPCQLDVEVGSVRGEVGVKGACDDEHEPHNLTLSEAEEGGGDGE